MTLETFAGDGTLQETKHTKLDAKSSMDVRLSRDGPFLGWIHILATGKKVVIATYKLEWIHDNVLETFDTQNGFFRDPGSYEELEDAQRGINHRWAYDRDRLPEAQEIFFVNLSGYPVSVAMCQEDYVCFSYSLPITVPANGQIRFTIGNKRYAVVESSPGFSVSARMYPSAGLKKIYSSSSSITFGQEVGR